MTEALALGMVSAAARAAAIDVRAVVGVDAREAGIRVLDLRLRSRARRRPTAS